MMVCTVIYQKPFRVNSLPLQFSVHLLHNIYYLMYVIIKVIIHKVCSLYGNHQKCSVHFEYWYPRKKWAIYVRQNQLTVNAQ